MAKLFSSVFKLATNDLANQFALPVKSLTGYVLTKRTAAKTDFLNRAVVEQMDIKPDDAILELGYGRGNGIAHCLQKMGPGRGMICGIERSSYMEEVAQKRFILEMKEEEKVRLDQALDLRNLPYPSDFFSHCFHVDVFYFVHHDRMMAVCQELNRVLRPGGTLVCGMQMKRLNRLTEWGLLNRAQWDPMRYMACLEPAGFVDVKIDYNEDSSSGPFQLITARRPEVGEDYFDPESRWRELELEIKREMLAEEMVKKGKRPAADDMEVLREQT